ncbi:MAG TPA: glycoside hydrolase family 16 protein [Dermatophilaceae bacterium]|nr:glycoside hydrolase family 16 protein [Dermatophilaceae bacterium]
MPGIRPVAPAPLRRRPARRRTVLMTVGLGVAAATLPTATVIATAVPPGATYQVSSPVMVPSAVTLASGLVFADEFNGAAGTRPNSRKWVYNTGNGSHGWGNGELETYTTTASNASTDGGGNLAITARKVAAGTAGTCWYGPCRYTSARLMTYSRFSIKYGRLEARIKVPSGTGLWPAFWSLDTNNVAKSSDPAYAEMDIMEHVGNDPTHVYSSLHGRTSSASMSACTQRTAPGEERFGARFHVFTVDWDSTKVTFSLDGVPFVTRHRTAFGAAWTFDQPLFLVLNLAVGGAWAGDPTSSTAFPARMLVDYVRVYRTPSSAVAAKAPAPATHAGGCDIAVV